MPGLSCWRRSPFFRRLAFCLRLPPGVRGAPTSTRGDSIGAAQRTIRGVDGVGAGLPGLPGSAGSSCSQLTKSWVSGAAEPSTGAPRRGAARGAKRGCRRALHAASLPEGRYGTPAPAKTTAALP